jgi:hypothetical protein
MIITNKFNLPAGLVKAVSTERHNAPGCLSATTLLQGVKQLLLADRHYDELTPDVSDLIWAIFGTAVHSLLESEGENDFTEQKMAYQIGEITVTGRIDNYNMATGTICDYKTASVNKVKFNNFSDWHRQGLIYAWLLNRNKFPANQCRFIALLKDHSKTEAERDQQYPCNPVCVYEFPVKSAELFKIGTFIRSRVGEYEKYLTAADDEIPPCSADERWERPSVFAVKKEGRQKAVKLFDIQEEAEVRAAELGKGHYVEHRVGKSVKCEHYCLCAGFCNYYQANVIGMKSALQTVTTGENAEKLVA